MKITKEVNKTSAKNFKMHHPTAQKRRSTMVRASIGPADSSRFMTNYSKPDALTIVGQGAGTGAHTNMLSITDRIAKTLEDIDTMLDVENSQELYNEMEQHIKGMQGPMKFQMRAFLDQYKNVTSTLDDITQERNEVLESLADWFTVMEDKADVWDNDDSLQKDKAAAKVAFDQVKQLQAKIEEFKESGQDYEHLEGELHAMQRKAIANFSKFKDKTIGAKLQSKPIVSAPQSVKEAKEDKVANDKPVSTSVAAVQRIQENNEMTKAWKYAASEIHDLLKKVRAEETGEVDKILQLLDDMVKKNREYSKELHDLENELRKQKALNLKWETENASLLEEKGKQGIKIKKLKKELKQTFMELEKHDDMINIPEYLRMDDETVDEDEQREKQARTDLISMDNPLKSNKKDLMKDAFFLEKMLAASKEEVNKLQREHATELKTAAEEMLQLRRIIKDQEHKVRETEQERQKLLKQLSANKTRMGSLRQMSLSHKPDAVSRRSTLTGSDSTIDNEEFTVRNSLRRRSTSSSIGSRPMSDGDETILTKEERGKRKHQAGGKPNSQDARTRLDEQDAEQMAEQDKSQEDKMLVGLKKRKVKGKSGTGKSKEATVGKESKDHKIAGKKVVKKGAMKGAAAASPEVEDGGGGAVNEDEAEAMEHKEGEEGEETQRAAREGTKSQRASVFDSKRRQSKAETLEVQLKNQITQLEEQIDHMKVENSQLKQQLGLNQMIQDRALDAQQAKASDKAAKGKKSPQEDGTASKGDVDLAEDDTQQDDQDLPTLQIRLEQMKAELQSTKDEVNNLRKENFKLANEANTLRTEVQIVKASTDNAVDPSIDLSNMSINIKKTRSQSKMADKNRKDGTGGLRKSDNGKPNNKSLKVSKRSKSIVSTEKLKTQQDKVFVDQSVQTMPGIGIRSRARLSQKSDMDNLDRDNIESGIIAFEEVGADLQGQIEQQSILLNELDWILEGVETFIDQMTTKVREKAGLIAQSATHHLEMLFWRLTNEPNKYASESLQFLKMNLDYTLLEQFETHILGSSSLEERLKPEILNMGQSCVHLMLDSWEHFIKIITTKINYLQALVFSGSDSSRGQGLHNQLQRFAQSGPKSDNVKGPVGGAIMQQQQFIDLLKLHEEEQPRGSWRQNRNNNIPGQMNNMSHMIPSMQDFLVDAEKMQVKPPAVAVATTGVVKKGPLMLSTGTNYGPAPIKQRKTKGLEILHLSKDKQKVVGEHADFQTQNQIVKQIESALHTDTKQFISNAHEVHSTHRGEKLAWLLTQDDINHDQVYSEYTTRQLEETAKEFATQQKLEFHEKLMDEINKRKAKDWIKK